MQSSLQGLDHAHRPCQGPPPGSSTLVRGPCLKTQRAGLSQGSAGSTPRTRTWVCGAVEPRGPRRDPLPQTHRAIKGWCEGGWGQAMQGSDVIGDEICISLAFYLHSTLVTPQLVNKNPKFLSHRQEGAATSCGQSP